ncbi:MAG: hypothetical protein ACW98Y_16725 [Candidatus Thorarchaeota archaeon]|jgi:hypothetical protein
MVSDGLITHPGYAICGAAADSLVTVLSMAGAVAFLVLMVGVFLGIRSEDGSLRFLRVKPLFLPSFVFVITLVIVVAFVPHPMASYHGLNEVQFQYYTTEFTEDVRVYDGVAYQSAIDILVVCNLESDESITVYVDFKQNNTTLETASLNLDGNAFGAQVTGEVAIQIQPGLYEAEVRYLPGYASFSTVTLSQPLTSGFFNEVLTWETYTMMMIVGSFFFILGGICIGREDRTRISQEKIDQEPPRDGAAYARRY